MSCDGCPLLGKKKVPTLHRPGHILIVGEAPGEDEVAPSPSMREPFVGAAGRKVKKLLPLVEEATVTNAVLCHPPKNKLPASAVKHCRAHVVALVEKYTDIFLLGANAFKAVFPDKEFKTYRGSALREDGRTFYVLYHPAAAMHNPDILPVLEEQYTKLYEMCINRTTSGMLEKLDPLILETYPDPWLVDKGDVDVVDCEWDEKGNLLIGLWTDQGVWQHSRKFVKPKRGEGVTSKEVCNFY